MNGGSAKISSRGRGMRFSRYKAAQKAAPEEFEFKQTEKGFTTETEDTKREG